jgi:hypothetical protein
MNAVKMCCLEAKEPGKGRNRPFFDELFHYLLTITFLMILFFLGTFCVKLYSLYLDFGIFAGSSDLLSMVLFVIILFLFWSGYRKLQRSYGSSPGSAR